MKVETYLPNDLEYVANVMHNGLMVGVLDGFHQQ